MMSDPLADPRATDLLSTDINDVASLAGVFCAAAVESQQTAVGLSAAQHDGVWTGTAADAFRRAIGRLPTKLEKVRFGFDAVANALFAYEGELGTIKPAFVRLIAELEDLQSKLGPAQSAAQGADGALRLAVRDPRMSIASLTKVELGAGRAAATVITLQGEIGWLQRRAFALLEEFAGVRSACQQAIVVAAASAPPRPLSGHGVTVIDL